MDQKKTPSAPKRCKKIDPVTLAREFRKTGDERVHSDVQGSYTGVTRDGDRPVQDVDDL